MGTWGTFLASNSWSSSLPTDTGFSFNYLWLLRAALFTHTQASFFILIMIFFKFYFWLVYQVSDFPMACPNTVSWSFCPLPPPPHLFPTPCLKPVRPERTLLSMHLPHYSVDCLSALGWDFLIVRASLEPSNSIGCSRHFIGSVNRIWLSYFSRWQSNRLAWGLIVGNWGSQDPIKFG